MDLTYFKTAAQLGVANLHSKGVGGTQRLMTALDLQDGQQILEIGCGTGETLLRIASTYRVCINAVDAVPQMIRTARWRLRMAGLTQRVTFHCIEPGQPLPFDDQTQDRVYHESVLAFQDAHVVRTLLAEIYRVLKPGGIYVANERIWKKDVSASIVSSHNEQEEHRFGFRGLPEYGWHVEDWLQLMEETGLEVVSAACLDQEDLSISSATGPASHWRVWVSRGFSFCCRASCVFKPAVLIRDFQYRQRIKKAPQSTQYAEPRLFVVRKPEDHIDQSS